MRRGERARAKRAEDQEKGYRPHCRLFTGW
jgi:hypothetical protein